MCTQFKYTLVLQTLAKFSAIKQRITYTTQSYTCAINPNGMTQNYATSYL